MYKEDEVQRIFNEITVYQNKKETVKKQFNLALDVTLMDEISIIQKGLQLLLESYVGKSEVVENILKKGLFTQGVAVVVDNIPYTFSEIKKVYKWVKEGLYAEIKDYLSDFNKLEKIVESVAWKLDTDIRFNDKSKDKNNIKINFDIKTVNIEQLDKEIIRAFIYELWDTFLISQNEYYRVKNLKYIGNIVPIEESIKIAIFFYKEFKILGKSYTVMEKIIKKYYKIHITEDNTEDINIDKINKIIIWTIINYIEFIFSLQEEDEEIFDDESYNITKSMHSVVKDYCQNYQDLKKSNDNYMIKKIKQNNVSKLNMEFFEENELLSDNIFIYKLEETLKKYIDENGSK